MITLLKEIAISLWIKRIIVGRHAEKSALHLMVGLKIVPHRTYRRENGVASDDMLVF